jgi:hypothetical protein
VLVPVLIASPIALGAESEEARAILDRGQRLDRTERKWRDRTQQLGFEIHGRTGDRTRTIRLYERRDESVRDHQLLLRVLDPPELRDLGLLQSTRPGESTRQWLYIPEFKRSRLIGGGLRDVPFIGSDLDHADLDLVTDLPGWDKSDAEASLVGEERVDEVDCHVIDLTPIDLTPNKPMAYGRIRIWLGKEDLFTRRLEFFEDERLKKRISQSAIRNVGTIPVAHAIVVETPSVGTRTRIAVGETRFDLGLPDECFSQATLDDVRREPSVCKTPPGF